MKIIDILENTDEFYDPNKIPTNPPELEDSEEFYDPNKIPTDPINVHEYAYQYYKKTGKRCYKVEHIIMEDPTLAYWYALNVIEGRWEEAEPYIMKSPADAYWYAKDVIKGRWPEAEHIIMTDNTIADWYAKKVMIPSVLKSNPNSKQIFNLLMAITKYYNNDKNEYDKLIKLVFPDSSIMVDKWINYGNKQRNKK